MAPVLRSRSPHPLPGTFYPHYGWAGVSVPQVCLQAALPRHGLPSDARARHMVTRRWGFRCAEKLDAGSWRPSFSDLFGVVVPEAVECCVSDAALVFRVSASSQPRIPKLRPKRSTPPPPARGSGTGWLIQRRAGSLSSLRRPPGAAEGAGGGADGRGDAWGFSLQLLFLVRWCLKGLFHRIDGAGGASCS
jgi:hypothetical protein